VENILPNNRLPKMNSSPNPHQPRMSPEEIVILFLNELPINPKRAFRYFSQEYRRKVGNYQGFQELYQEAPLWRVLNSYPSWDFLTSNSTKDDSVELIYKIRFIDSQKMMRHVKVKFKLSQQYNWKLNQPIYDDWAHKNLYGYWRIDRVQFALYPKNKRLVEQFVDSSDKNINGGPLQICSLDPVTGWHRDGYCRYEKGDFGKHTVCARVNKKFLDYTKSQGNDLSTPKGKHFKGLKPGDKWCLCEDRYRQAVRAGNKPKLVKNATHYVSRKVKDI
jgi:uncharacterized protein (DUF2237 family)